MAVSLHTHLYPDDTIKIVASGPPRQVYEALRDLAGGAATPPSPPPQEVILAGRGLRMAQYVTDALMIRDEEWAQALRLGMPVLPGPRIPMEVQGWVERVRERLR